MSPTRRSKGIRLAISLGVLASLALGSLPPAGQAATGDFVATAMFETPCGSGVGVGIAFDGTHLWYSCYASSPDLFRADPHTGDVVAEYTIVGGLGALAYDVGRNAIWAGWGGGTTGDVVLVQLDAAKNVVSSAVAFNVAAEAGSSGLDDGLAYDGEDDTLYISPDGSTVIDHFDSSGAHLGEFPWAGDECFNSGLAIGGDLLYEGSNGCSHVWVVDKSDTSTVVFDFGTAQPDDPNFRDEDLECDPITFAAAGKEVMWSVEAYEPRRAHAFEIPAGSCGFGGQPAEEICGDGIDNDRDGEIDEGCPEVCGDGIDNDRDGLVDEGCLPGRMTGGGTVGNESPRVTHGFALDCDATALPQSLEINWGKGNRFHLMQVVSAECGDDPAISPGMPDAPFDTLRGEGKGTLNGVPGATARYTLTDAGEPGKEDYAFLVVYDAGNNVVLTRAGLLDNGNHQAHAG